MVQVSERVQMGERTNEHGYKGSVRLVYYFGLLMTHRHSLRSRYHLAAIESRLRRPSL